MFEKMTICTTCFAAGTVLVAVLGLQQLHHAEERKAMNVKRITPVLFVKEIEPVLPFWVDKLGFTKTIEVPHGTKIGFVALQKGSTEVMYQSYASLEDDMPLIAETRKGPTFLYIEVDNLDAVLTALKDSKIVQPERTAFYGMREVGFQEPGGHYVTFAQPVAAAQH
jgi:Glyoxalase/Bleomycin resistance protein/Dioxygenase superfamily